MNETGEGLNLLQKCEDEYYRRAGIVHRARKSLHDYVQGVHEARVLDSGFDYWGQSIDVLEVTAEREIEALRAIDHSAWSTARTLFDQTKEGRNDEERRSHTVEQ